MVIDVSARGLAAETLDCVRGERTVFTGVDFAVAPGSSLVLTGANGSGKSSLLRLLAGLLNPARGRILWDGENVAEDRAAYSARLRYVGHQNVLKPALSVTENLAFWAGLHGDPRTANRVVAAALERLCLGHLAEVPAQLLSAGQRRRLALARIAAAPAPLWLLDEPTVTLDRESVATVEALMADHCAGGGLIVVATHIGLKVPNAAVLTLGEAA